MRKSINPFSNRDSTAKQRLRLNQLARHQGTNCSSKLLVISHVVTPPTMTSRSLPASPLHKSILPTSPKRKSSPSPPSNVSLPSSPSSRSLPAFAHQHVDLLVAIRETSSERLAFGCELISALLARHLLRHIPRRWHGPAPVSGGSCAKKPAAGASTVFACHGELWLRPDW